MDKFQIFSACKINSLYNLGCLPKKMTVIVFQGIKLFIFESRFFLAKNDISERRQHLSTLITYSLKIQQLSFFLCNYPIFYRRKGFRRRKMSKIFMDMAHFARFCQDNSFSKRILGFLFFKHDFSHTHIIIIIVIMALLPVGLF